MEDDADLARLLQNKLQRAGYIVDVASDGAEGLRERFLRRTGRGQTMPIHDGIEVIRILWKTSTPARPDLAPPNWRNWCVVAHRAGGLLG